MQYKIKYLLVTALALLSFSAFSQINTYSPYSRFGLGQLTVPGLGQSSGMGNAGIALGSTNQINYINPASYSTIDTMSFIFDFGIAGSSTKYKSNLTHTKLNNFNLQHISIGFPVTKWWKAAAGITPFSSVGYKISEEKTIEGVGNVSYYYNGNGGLSKFFIGSSVTLFKHLSLGVNMSTLFGYIENEQQAQFLDITGSSATHFSLRDDIGGIMFNLGARYTQTFADKYFITLGAIFDNETKLKDTRTYLVQNTFPGAGFNLPIDTTYTINDGDTTATTIQYRAYNPDQERINQVTDGSVIYPKNFGMGIAFGIKDRLTITGDYYSQQWSKSRILGKTDSLTNSSAMRFGMELVPNPTALRGYLNHVHFRLGGYYSNSYIRIRGEQLNDYGITFGVGLPFKNTNTTFNLGVVLGQRGTLNNNLIKENYEIFNVSLVLQDFWFFKRKFD